MRKLSDILADIRNTEHRIKMLKEDMQYADHGAYGQDKDRLAALQMRLGELKSELAQVDAAP